MKTLITNSNAQATLSQLTPARPTAAHGGLPVRTNLRAGSNEDAFAQVQAWWQNLVNSLTASGNQANSSNQTNSSNQ